MKIIRPENINENKHVKAEIKVKNTNTVVGVGDIEKITFIDDNDEPETIEDVMKSVLEENTNTVSFNITLTKRQYELYTRKGGICWLKKALVGQKQKKKSTKNRKLS